MRFLMGQRFRSAERRRRHGRLGFFVAPLNGKHVFSAQMREQGRLEIAGQRSEGPAVPPALKRSASRR
jgi:hypothetical protein